MEPSPTKKKPKPLVAILAVLIPLAAIGVAAVVTTNTTGDGSATATTLSQDGDPEAAARAAEEKAAGTGSATKDSSSTTSTTKDKDKDTTTSAAPETPSSPAAAGPEGERTSVTYPQPTVPASGCSTRSGTAVITLGTKPDPACLTLAADQPVIVRNRTGKEISFIAISVNEVVPADGESRLGSAGDAFGGGRSTFWSPGNPQLSGIVIVG